MEFVCVVKSCVNNTLETKEIGCQLYGLPKDKSLAHQWLKKCGRLDLCCKPLTELTNYVHVCSKHFTVDMCSSPEKIRLLPMAVPTELKSTGANCNEPNPSLYLDEATYPGLIDGQSNSCATSSNTSQTIELPNKSRTLNGKMYQSYNFSLRRPQSEFTNAPIAQHNPIFEFKILPFCKTIENLLITEIILINNKTTYNGSFSLSNDLRCLIKNSWNEDLREYKVRVILRLEQVGEKVMERLPYNLIVSVNNVCCELPKGNTSKERGSIPWRYNVPINITQYVNLITDGFQNNVQFFWSREPNQYKAGIIVVEKLIGSELVQQLNERPFFPSFKTIMLIRNTLNGPHQDADIRADTIVISIQDPLSKMRMQFPSRGSSCVHVQCFDGLQFMLMNEQIERWKCPLCSKTSKFENIVIDKYFLDIIKSPCLSAECENVFLKFDGSWAEEKEKKSTNLGNSLEPCSSRNSRTNPRQDKEKSKNVLCVITLD